MAFLTLCQLPHTTLSMCKGHRRRPHRVLTPTAEQKWLPSASWSGARRGKPVTPEGDGLGKDSGAPSTSSWLLGAWAGGQGMLWGDGLSGGWLGTLGEQQTVRLQVARLRQLPGVSGHKCPSSTGCWLERPGLLIAQLDWCTLC